MSINVTVPELGESVVEATVVRWFKSEGESVKIGEPLVELETEKANFEVAAEKEGILGSIRKKDGEDVEVGDVLCVLEEGKAAEPSGTKGSPKPSGQVKEETVKGPGPAEEKATPVARRIAEEKGVDLGKVEGTGPSCRITKVDVEIHIE